MGRHILHVDMNAFYASVECQRRPELRQKPVAVCGDPEARHGIVLTANYVAKPRGVKTGMAIWQAKQLCPDLVVLPADMREYIRFSKMAREIYEKYTDQIEPFGLDESWLDVTGSVGLFGSAVSIAEEISERIKFELGITASIGVSDNKITAKLGIGGNDLLQLCLADAPYLQQPLRFILQHMQCICAKPVYDQLGGLAANALDKP